MNKQNDTDLTGDTEPQPGYWKKAVMPQCAHGVSLDSVCDECAKLDAAKLEIERHVERRLIPSG
jgi:hypothetical protein